MSNKSINCPKERMTFREAEFQINELTESLYELLVKLSSSVSLDLDTRYHRVQISAKVQDLMVLCKAIESNRIKALGKQTIT